MISRLSCNIKGLITSLLVIFCFPLFLFSQEKIKDVINEYGRVTAMGIDFVIVDDPAEYSKFKKNDTVLLVQMKGVKSQVPENGSYGNFQISEGTPGAYEFLIIEDTLAKKIIFRNSIIKNYDVLGLVQLVRVPSYYSAEVDEELTCAPWNNISKTGGILAMIVGTKLTLNANISVLGKGFAGGSPVTGLGICIDPDLVLNNKFSYPETYTNSGLKGESHVISAYIDGTTEYPIFPGYAKGRGANYTGGGGGSGHFSGGGGGSLRGAGGNGGDERSEGGCAPESGGIGGKSSSINFRESPEEDRGIYLGGGGGGSTYTTGTATAGGNGGGIIIILCETLDGNGHSIIADGQTPAAQAIGEAGAGGGGAGGSIALYLQNFTNTNLTISAKGGNGGNSDGPGGTGGGGGGGLINISPSAIPIPGDITRSSAGGNFGEWPEHGQYLATVGEPGDILSTFVPFLNGFLFNTIKSSITLSQTDAICSNVVPKKLLGTIPVGGSGDYTYTWQKTYFLLTAPVDVASSTELVDFTPLDMETSDSVYFRRIVKDNILPTLPDISKWVGIDVQPQITNNVIGKDTIICYNQDPAGLLSLNGKPENGNGKYSYLWEKYNSPDWVVLPDTLENYNPSALTDTAYYKRRVISGRCVDYSNTVTITVLPSITGNILNTPADPVICEGKEFNTLTGLLALGGGADSYTYSWQDSISGTWKHVLGATLPYYEPDASLFNQDTIKRYYRRLVLSGAFDVCKDTSETIMLTRYPKIIDNTITGPQVICEGTQPSRLIGLQPLGGAGADTYIYSWQQSTVSGVWSDTTIITLDYQPDNLDANHWFRRIVESSVCKDTSAPVLIKVQPAIRKNLISLQSGQMDSTICAGAQPYRIIGNVSPTLTGGTGSDYTFEWLTSLNNTDWNDISATNSFYQPTTLNLPTWFKRVVISDAGICKDTTDIVRINVLPPIVNTIPADKEVCINTVSDPVKSLTLTGGEEGNYQYLWQDSTMNRDWTNITAETEDITLPLLTDPAKYRRKVWSGPNKTCFSVSNPVRVSVTPLPYPVFAGSDTILSTFEYLYDLRADRPDLGTGTWSIESSSGNPSFDDESLHNTIVRNLAPGLNTLSWRVVNGVCEVKSLVNIEIINIGIPSGISPDGNGQNDSLYIKGLDFINHSIELTILNSAGSQVYYTSNKEGKTWKTWEGMNSDGAELPEGTYYYLLTISSNRTTVRPEKRSGFVILKRY